MFQSGKRLIKLPEVMWRTGLSRSSVYRKMEKGEFPKQVKQGEGGVAWWEHEVEDWMESLPQKS